MFRVQGVQTGREPEVAAPLAAVEMHPRTFRASYERGRAALRRERAGADGLRDAGRRPVAIMALTSVVIVFGMFFVGYLPVDLLPPLEYPPIRVTVNHPGTAPRSV